MATDSNPHDHRYDSLISGKVLKIIYRVFRHWNISFKFLKMEVCYKYYRKGNYLWITHRTGGTQLIYNGYYFIEKILNYKDQFSILNKIVSVNWAIECYLKSSKCTYVYGSILYKTYNCQLKEEALDRTMWRNPLGRGFGPVVWQIIDDDDDNCYTLRPLMWPSSGEVHCRGEIHRNYT